MKRCIDFGASTLLAVPEKYWGRNYGKTLMERAEKIAAQRLRRSVA
ncbi:GNAT family N-acetyltransferase [Sphingomonas aerolata]